MKKMHAALIAIAALILTGSLLFGGLQLYANQRTIPEGTRLSGWEIGGLNMEEVRSGLDERLKQLEALPLVLQVEGKPDLRLTLAEAGISYEASSFLRELQGLEEGRLWDRVKRRWHFPRSWTLSARADLQPLQQRLNPAWEQDTFGVPVSATRRITTDDRVIYTPDSTSRQVDWPAFATLMQAALSLRLNDLDSLQRSGGITLELPLQIWEPEVTLQSLKAEGVERKIAEFSTSLGASGPGRIHNVDAAARAVNDTVLPPGAVFDYGKAIEKARQEYGFREAPVIVGGNLQAGVGGGICQVSSTLYNAALRSGLEIVERRNHSLPVNYLPMGQDATFAEGYINFRFRNNTGKYLVVKSSVQGRTLTVKLFGTFPRNVSYAITSRTVEVLSPKDRIIHDSSLPRGSKRVLQNGKSGYVVETYITRYVDGKAEERKLLSRDVYPAQRRLVAANTARAQKSAVPEASERPLLEDGVRSR